MGAQRREGESRSGGGCCVPHQRGAGDAVGVGDADDRRRRAAERVHRGEVDRRVLDHRAVVDVGGEVGAVAADQAQPIPGRVEVDAGAHALRQGLGEPGLLLHLAGARVDRHHAAAAEHAVELAVGGSDVDADDPAADADIDRTRHGRPVGVDDEEGARTGECCQRRRLGVAGRRRQARDDGGACEQVLASDHVRSPLSVAVERPAPLTSPYAGAVGFGGRRGGSHAREAGDLVEHRGRAAIAG